MRTRDDDEDLPPWIARPTSRQRIESSPPRRSAPQHQQRQEQQRQEPQQPKRSAFQYSPPRARPDPRPLPQHYQQQQAPRHYHQQQQPRAHYQHQQQQQQQPPPFQAPPPEVHSSQPKVAVAVAYEQQQYEKPREQWRQEQRRQEDRRQEQQRQEYERPREQQHQERPSGPKESGPKESEPNKEKGPLKHWRDEHGLQMDDLRALDIQVAACRFHPTAALLVKIEFTFTKYMTENYLSTLGMARVLHKGGIKNIWIINAEGALGFMRQDDYAKGRPLEEVFAALKLPDNDGSTPVEAVAIEMHDHEFANRVKQAREDIKRPQ